MSVNWQMLFRPASEIISPACLCCTVGGWTPAFAGMTPGGDGNHLMYIDFIGVERREIVRLC